MSDHRKLASLALAAAALALCLGVALCFTGCKGGSTMDWSGGIVCKDGICTPTLTLQPTIPAARAQLEK